LIGIRNGKVLTTDGIVEVDLGIEDGLVTRMGGRFDAGEEIDAAGAWVGPGLVDLHVHLREPGMEWKEDIESGSAAAAAGGFTAVVAMPNTDPAIDRGHLARYVVDRGRKVGLCRVAVAGAISLGRKGESLAHLDEMWEAGVRMFSDDGSSVADAGLLRNAMEYLAELGGVVAQHAEDPGLARGGHMHEGPVSSRLGIGGLPSLAEELIIRRDLSLAKMTGSRYHAQHVSTTATVELIREAKAAGLAVTAEVTPHHLTFDHHAVESLDPAFKMYPPLRTESDVAALRAGLSSGIIDAVATDHAPHASHECEVPFEEAPRGVIGLETAAAAMNTALNPDPMIFFDRMSVAPARIGGLAEHGRPLEVGAPAHLTILDPNATWTPQAFRSKSSNSPFLGMELRGRVMATIYEGRLTYQLIKAIR
jgi:dihydroorotase